MHYVLHRRSSLAVICLRYHSVGLALHYMSELRSHILSPNLVGRHGFDYVQFDLESLTKLVGTENMKYSLRFVVISKNVRGREQISFLPASPSPHNLIPRKVPHSCICILEVKNTRSNK